MTMNINGFHQTSHKRQCYEELAKKKKEKEEKLERILKAKLCRLMRGDACWRKRLLILFRLNDYAFPSNGRMNPKVASFYEWQLRKAQTRQKNINWKQMVTEGFAHLSKNTNTSFWFLNFIQISKFEFRFSLFPSRSWSNAEKTIKNFCLLIFKSFVDRKRKLQMWQREINAYFMRICCEPIGLESFFLLPLALALALAPESIFSYS